MLLYCVNCGKPLNSDIFANGFCKDCFIKLNTQQGKEKPIPHGCPFCEPPTDGEATVKSVIDDEFDETWYYVKCNYCGATSGEYATPEIAVNAWNAATNKGTAK